MICRGCQEEGTGRVVGESRGRSRSVGSVIREVCEICADRPTDQRTNVPHVLRVFHRSWGMYLRTYSPYLDSLSLVIVNFRIQLELIYWALYSTVDCTCHRSCLTYIPSPLPDLTVFTHKVPSQSSIVIYMALDCNQRPPLLLPY